MNSRFKFPRRVRIHGGECGAVARALHHEAQKVALTQNEQTLISDECVFLGQADDEKSSKSTFSERKQMSTKQTFLKRIALVAVSALGFGMFVVVTPANAAPTNGALPYSLTATLDTATTTIGGRVGQEVSINVTGKVDAVTDATVAAAAGSTTYTVLSIAASITSQPATSTVYATVAPWATNVGSLTVFGFNNATGTATSGSTTGTATTVATINYANETEDKGTGEIVAGTRLATVKFTPTVAGTYSLVVWNERDRSWGNASSSVSAASSNSALSGSESSQTFTINVSSGVSSVVLSPVNSTAAAAGVNGALVKVSLKDAAGNAAILAPGETVTITPSGTGDIAGVNGAEVTSAAGAAYNLASTDFNSSGVAWVNVTAATKQTVNLTASLSGGATTSTSLSFVTITASTVAPAPYSATAVGYVLSTGSLYSVPKGASTTTFSVDTGSAAASANFTVRETTTLGGVGAISGFTTRLAYDGAATAGTTGVAYFSVSITDATSTTTAQEAYSVYSVDGNFNAAGTVETRIQTIATAAGTLTRTPSLINATVGSTNKIGATLVDQFGRAYPYVTITGTVAGKNPTTSAMVAVTDANGKVEFSVTDANTNTAVNDVLTIAVSGGSSTTATITYGTNTVSKVTLEYPNEDDVVAGTTFTEISAAGAGATGTSATVTAIVTGSTGALLAGVPVTFAVSGLTGAEVHTTKVTVYTDAAGKAATSISSYAAGKATVTATAGGVSSSADIYFKQTGATEARTIAATVSGSVVTATVKDRYGNTIEGVTVNATRTGSGYFGSGASTASGNTDKNGQIEFIFTGTGTVTVAFTSADYGQSADAAGYVGITAVTASAAGTTTTAQKGLGAALAPAGVNSASVAVASVDAAAAAAEAASDAAAEAIDAANAATDAANLAAEAADAATVAAEEARDAADAATAAVEELATQVATLMAALKAQITTLANTVAKIAKKVKA